VYPLDTIKTRLQSQDFVKTYASSTGTKKAPATLFRGLYQGVGSVIIATLPACEFSHKQPLYTSPMMYI
jgi:solute carrier family 25 (mitochondrial S-adenosylmethionine transporter), member 26